MWYLHKTAEPSYTFRHYLIYERCEWYEVVRSIGKLCTIRLSSNNERSNEKQKEFTKKDTNNIVNIVKKTKSYDKGNQCNCGSNKLTLLKERDRTKPIQVEFPAAKHNESTFSLISYRFLSYCRWSFVLGFTCARHFASFRRLSYLAKFINKSEQ